MSKLAGSPRPTRRLAATAGIAGAVLLAAAGSAQAAQQTITRSGETAFTVPPNVTSMQISAIGGNGGNSISGSGGIQQSGGQGRSVSATIAVTPGEILYVEVGANGQNGRGLGGAGGGGATDVRTCSASAQTCPNGVPTLQTRLLVAGGGGGAGGSTIGGAGGGSDEDGSDGQGNPGSGAGAGTTNAGGQSGGGFGSQNQGQFGTLGAGGNGGAPNAGSQGGGNGGANGGGAGGMSDGTLAGGGGGGGGWYGGGGGEGGTNADPTGAGGGAGGASYVTPGASSVQMGWTSSNPSVTLTWTANPAPPQPPPLITAVSPNTSTTAGGISVNIQGSWFSQIRQVYFGNVAATRFQVTGFTTMTAIVPAVTNAGTVDIRIVGPQGQASAVVPADQFTFTAVPAPPNPTPPNPNPTPPNPPAGVCIVPDVIGDRLGAAKRALRGANCQLGVIREPRSRRGRLRVQRQSIPPGTHLVQGDTVALTMKRVVRRR